MAKHIALGMTGASGALYGLRVLQVLLEQGHQVSLMMSKPAHLVLALEHDIKVPRRANDAKRFFAERYAFDESLLTVYGGEDWTAPVASGSNPPDAMVICPCTTGTLASVATGMSNSLLERAADVVIKEQRKLIMVVRETPLSAIHLEHMLKLAQLGVCILPAAPGFYHKPESIDDIVDFMAARVLDQLSINHSLTPRWGADK